MSSPFHYSPRAECFPPTPNAWGYPRETIWPSSPYNGPPIVPDNDGTPNTPERPLYSGLNSEYPWTTSRPRQRRMSWNGPTPTSPSPPVTPFIPPTPISAFSEPRFAWPTPAPPVPTQWFPETPVVPPLPPPQIAPPIPSFAPSSSYVPPTPYIPYTPASVVPPYLPPVPAPTQFQIHPLLNGEAPNELSFDLALTSFAPHRAMGPEHFVPLASAELTQGAFFPAVTRLRIVCDALPKWPVDVNPEGLPGPAITLGDILVAVHKEMHKPISHPDWDELSTEQEAAVSQAFTKRCRAETDMRRAMGGFDYVDVPARRQGVKVVDFLKGKTMFRGLVRDEAGLVKMLVS